jgi:hypothetical protein
MAWKEKCAPQKFLSIYEQTLLFIFSCKRAHDSEEREKNTKCLLPYVIEATHMYKLQ